MENNKRSIFVLDDNPVFLFWLKEQLQNAGNFEVNNFSTPSEFLSHLHHKPELIILDYYLGPEYGLQLDGLQFLKVVKHNYPSIPVLLVSGKPDATMTMQAFQSGAFDVVKKSEHTHIKILNLIKCMEIVNKLDQQPPNLLNYVS